MIPCCVLRSTLKHAMEVVSLLLPLLSMVWRPWRAPLTIPNAEARLQPYGILFALRLDVCVNSSKSTLRKANEGLKEYK
ncbi:hypothetical protein U9M48_027783 [Paspalum notatum var. saurae]|uniref:Uncharacterized protein n=1 Tax=Paspalum notatum var. saurae TaxID=547442 RepID=A0AAQ3WZR7_PASNO